MKQIHQQHLALLNAAEHGRMILRKLREEVSEEQRRAIDHVCGVLHAAIRNREPVDARPFTRRER